MSNFRLLNKHKNCECPSSTENKLFLEFLVVMNMSWIILLPKISGLEKQV